MQAAIVILALGLIVIAHELGHFLTGLIFGVRAKSLGIGFGPTLLSRRFKGVDYRLNLLPLGGYVDFEKRMEQVSPKQRLAVALGGVVANLILAVILSVVFVLVFRTPLTLIGDIVIWKLNLANTVVFTWQSFVSTMSLVWSGVAAMFAPQGLAQMVGPIGIVSVGADLMKTNMLAIIPVAMIINANVFFINLLPFPGLDGARAVFSLIGLITRKPIPKEEYIHACGVALVLCLSLWLIAKDIGTVFVK